MASPNFFLFRGFSWGFETNPIFTGWDCQPHAQPPTWRTRVSLFVWVIIFDLSCMGAPASSYATAFFDHACRATTSKQGYLRRVLILLVCLTFKSTGTRGTWNSTLVE
jgi:hypothetical protein